MAESKGRQLHAWQLSFGEMSRPLIVTFFSFFFFILSFPLFTHAAQVTIGWDASTDPSVTGYKLYYGTSSRNYHAVIEAGNKTTCTISGLPDGSTYYLAVTSYYASGIESLYSDEVVYNSANPASPPTVNDFNGDGKTDVLWRHTSGMVAIWLMNGLTVGSWGVPAGIDSSWQIKAVGDFDGDGKGDVLWQNTSGTVAIWLMNGLTVGSCGVPEIGRAHV